jgi:hypothetical protein
MLPAEDEVLERSLYRAKLGRDLRLADVTSRRALQFGVTASIGAGEDYAESHIFAADVLAAGFAGIRYLVPHVRQRRAARLRCESGVRDWSWRGPVRAVFQ